MKNLLVGQSGGPPAVINASLYGVVKAALASPEIGHVYGMVNGIEGMLQDHTLDLGESLSEEDLELLKLTPAAYLGSCRYKLPESLTDAFYETIFEKFRRMEIGYFLYIGGNDSMDTVSKLSLPCGRLPWMHPYISRRQSPSWNLWDAMPDGLRQPVRWPASLRATTRYSFTCRRQILNWSSSQRT